MKIDHFRTFCTVVEMGSLSEAAKQLFLTQPAVTQQIKNLEYRYSLQLLERTSRGISLTAPGEIFYGYAKKIVSLYDELETRITDLRSEVSGEVVVGATSTIGGYALPCSIWLFKERFPEANVKLKIGNRTQITDYLLDKTVDLALIEGPALEGPFIKNEITTDELVVIAPTTPEWVGRTTISVKDLVHAPFIMREVGSGTREVIEDALRSLGIHPEDLSIVMELSSVDAVKTAVEAGVGISIISLLAVRKELRSRMLTVLRLEGVSFLQRITMAYCENKQLTRAARAFMDFLSSPNRGFC